ncbi:MAG: alanine--tRNA ligase [Patescibacteria group bacterium]
MHTQKIRKKFISFFTKHKHAVVESSSLWPQDDPSVLLTTAGMQQFKPYFMGEKDALHDFKSLRLASVQRCFRTSDIDLVGDATHGTFFEMLGNFSIHDYFKKESISLAWTFLTEELKLDPKRLWATYFLGSDDVAADTETKDLWLAYLPAERVIGFGKEDNWWGPPGASGPCGPCSEIHYDVTGPQDGTDDRPNSDSGRFMEIWNLVFTEYHMDVRKKISKLKTRNIDTGMGLERLAMVLQKKRAVGDIDVNAPLIEYIMGNEHFGNTNMTEDLWRARIVADHIKGSIFLIADGVAFSNKEQGYILRRIFRRALDQYLHPTFDLQTLVDRIISTYAEQYPHLNSARDNILAAMHKELLAYEKIIRIDVDEMVRKLKTIPYRRDQSVEMPVGPSTRVISAEDAFTLYSTYGISADRLKRKGYSFDTAQFEAIVAEHQQKSRSGSQSKFGGHGINSSELSNEQRSIMTRLHTATHLLHQALRQILGEHVRQQGSDITPERLRFDFEHPQKITSEQLEAIERLVNEKIQDDLPVTKEEMDYDSAISSGALAFFKEKYGNKVSVYSVGNFSKELCGGPHVQHSGEIGKFHIVSEKSSSAGVRRIKAVITDN